MQEKCWKRPAYCFSQGKWQSSFPPPGSLKCICLVGAKYCPGWSRVMAAFVLSRPFRTARVGAHCSYVWAMGAVDTDIFLYLIACLLSHSVVSGPLQPCGPEPSRLLCPWDFPSKNTGVGCHFLLQGYTLFTLSQILNISCKPDEIRCIRGWKPTVTPLVGGWVGIQSRGVSDDLHTGCLPQGVVCWLVSGGVWICQGQTVWWEQSQPCLEKWLCSCVQALNYHRAGSGRALAFVADGLPSPCTVGFLQGWHSGGPLSVLLAAAFLCLWSWSLGNAKFQEVWSALQSLVWLVVGISHVVLNFKSLRCYNVKLTK